ncbi:MAG: ATP-binding protein [Actinomycetia bacterium]|nr:ATP-binding protein [Actinomycetes bacterium]
MPLPDSADTTAVEVLLPRHPRRVAEARQATRKALEAWRIPSDAAEAVVLVVSELVTNAIRHAKAPADRRIGLRITRPAPDRVRVEVADAGTAVPRLRTPLDDDESSRGLPLVAALSTRHGVCPRRDGVGKTVWAEVPTD